jgi:uncharacterized protein
MSPLSDEDGQRLLGIARQSVEEAVRGASPGELRGVSGALLENAGVFVTLRNHGLLRGCIGHIEPNEPLARCVAECARAAALRDPRFAPVSDAELPDISVHISVLSPLFDIRPDEIEIGRHGLYVTLEFYRGILLPQVPVEWNWDRERFLSETCAKAGLPPDAWRQGARIQGFTTWDFAEHSSPNVGAELASSRPHSQAS